MVCAREEIQLDDHSNPCWPYVYMREKKGAFCTPVFVNLHL